jgi:SWI/SNF-related matrix-associated actin-dependent regulator of chromatin subfamily A3
VGHELEFYLTQYERLTWAIRNAIAVQNIGRTQVGHIPRQTVAKLAPLIDAGLITVEGTMNEGNRE